MSTFKFKDYNIYYETYGEGKPLVILNGIMMSTQSWGHLIDPISPYCKLVLVDMIDQGQSDNGPDVYNHDIQVNIIKGLFDHLEIEEANLFGISYGGEIALQFVLKYPDLVDRLLLFNTTSWTSPWLNEVGNAWNLASGNWESYYATTIPVIYSPQFYADNIEWITERKEILKGVFSDEKFMSRMIRLTDSSTDYDIRDNIYNIAQKTLIVASEFDFVTPKHEQVFLSERIKNSNFVLIPNVGHASMYEVPDLFISLVLGFILH